VTDKIIGIGNAWRGDDGAGAAVAERLREMGIDAEAQDGDGAELMESWKGCDGAIIIDAAVSGAPPGVVHRFDAAESEIPKRFFRYSSHLFGVAEAVETARLLGRLPKRLIVYGIEGANFNLGSPMSPEVEKAVTETAALIKGELDHA